LSNASLDISCENWISEKNCQVQIYYWEIFYTCTTVVTCIDEFANHFDTKCEVSRQTLFQHVPFFYTIPYCAIIIHFVIFFLLIFRYFLHNNRLCKYITRFLQWKFEVEIFVWTNLKMTEVKAVKRVNFFIILNCTEQKHWVNTFFHTSTYFIISW